MQKTSDLYKEILSGEHWKEYRLVIGDVANNDGGYLVTELNEAILFGGVRILVGGGYADSGYAEDRIVTMNTYGGLFSENMPVVGECVAGEISATILKPKADIPRMSRVIPFVRLCNGEKQSEWIRKGVYYIDKHSYSGEETELMQIHGFDAMLFSEADFPSSDDEWPRTDIDVVRDIATEMGVALDPRTEAIMNKGYMVQYPAEYSQREVLGFLAAMYAGSFVMSENGELRLIQLGASADSIDLGKKATSITKAERFDAYSKIIISVTDELFYEAGDETGRTLNISCPWGTQEMADNLLSQMGGFFYQPFTAEGAMLDPAAELGDGINVDGVTSCVYHMDTIFNSNCSANISAPFDEEINTAFPYESKLNREVKRQNKKFSSQLSIQADRIASVVEETRSEFDSVKSTLEVQSGQIVAKVNKVQSATSSTFGWALETASWRIFAGTSTVLKATKDGLEVKGKITATDGTIGGFTIKGDHISYNDHTWGADNATGIYIGVMGIQLGKNFKVDSAGNLYAYSGTFEGTVTAGNILYGEKDGKSYGTLDGSALTGGTVNGTALTNNTIAGGKLKYNTVSTSYTSTGINTSLGWADFANLIFEGINKANYLYAHQMGADRFHLGDYDAGWMTLNYLDHDGDKKSIRIMTGQGGQG